MNPAVTQVLQRAIGDVGTIVDADMAALKAQLGVQISQMVNPLDVLTDKVQAVSFSNLQQYIRSGQVPGTKVGQDREILLQWGDAGGVKGDSSPGTTIKPHGQAQWSPEPPSAGAPASLTWAPAAGYDNLYFYITLPVPHAAPKYFYSSRSYQFLSGTDRVASQALESDSQLVWDGWQYNFGTQMDFVGGAGWRFFDPNAQAWFSLRTPVPVPDLVSKPVVFTTESMIDTVAHTITRVAITVNGVRYPVGAEVPARSVSQGNKYSAAIQMDATAAATFYRVQVAEFEERYLIV